MPRIVISAARQGASEAPPNPAELNPARHAERLEAFAVRPFRFRASDLQNDTLARQSTRAWKRFLTEMGSQPAAGAEALKSFVALYNPRLLEWNEQCQLACVWERENVAKHFQLPFLEAVDGSKVMHLFETCMLKTAANIRGQKPLDKLLCLEIAYLMNLMTRLPDNQRYLRHSTILELCVVILKNLSTHARGFLGSNVAGSPPSSLPLIMQLLVVQVLQIIMNHFAFFGHWDMAGASLTQDSQEIIQCKSDLLRSEFLFVIDACLRHLGTVGGRVRRQSNQDTGGSLRNVHEHLLHTVGVFLFQFPLGRKNITQTNLLERLIEPLGWPAVLVHSDGEQISVTSNPELQEEFSIQLLCLRVLLEAVTGMMNNVQRVNELGGWAMLIDVVLWTTEVFSINHLLAEVQATEDGPSTDESDEPSPTAKPGRVPELKNLFEVLYYLIVGSLSGNSRRRVKNEGDAGGQGQVKELTISPELNRNVLGAVIDLFNEDVRHTPGAARVRQQVEQAVPELQTHVLELMVNVIQNYPPAVSLCHKDRFWDLLFSRYFFYCGRQEGLLKGVELRDSVKATPPQQQWYFKKLHQQVLLFIKFTGALPHHSNLHECARLINLVDCYHFDADLLLHMYAVLETFLSQKLATTQHALARLGALPVLFGCLQKQQLTYSRLSEVPTTERDRLGFSLDTCLRARHATLRVLVSYFQDNEEAHALFLQNQDMIDILLSHLREPNLRETALKLTLALMVPGKQSRSTLTPLYGDYFKEFRRAQEMEGGDDEDFNLLLVLLFGIRSLVLRSHKTRHLLRETGAFLNMTSVLNNEERLERLPELCIEVLKTLMCLMAGSEKNKAHMQHDIGYDQLVALVLRALHADKEAKLLHNLLPLLFDLLVDGKFNLETRYVIQNPDIIDFMLQLIMDPSVPEKQRNELFDTFITLVDKCPLNRALCCERQLIFCLLELIPQPLVQHNEDLQQRLYSLIELLGTHSITVKELKKQFLLLKSRPGDFRPPGQIRLMKALQFMALSRSTGPLTFFDFNGKNSALELPALEKWPRSNGYTFCLWVRVESFSELNGPGSPPRLVSFLDQEGLGLELYLIRDLNSEQRFFLELSLASSSGKFLSHRFTSTSMELRRWYFVTISHANQIKLRLKDAELHLYVNGKSREKVQLRYPQFPPLLNRVCIGSNFPVNGTLRRLTTCGYFHGQMGPFVLFDEAVTSSQAQFLFDTTNHLLRNGTSCFQDLESKLVLYYNSNARAGKKFLDLTPEHQRERRMDALMRGKLYSCTTPDIKDTIHCLGGIQVLFPIFAQLDQPEEPRTPDSPINYQVDSRLLLQALALLGDMLFKSDTNQQELLRCQGFQVIGFLIEQASPAHITSEAVVTLEDIVLNKTEGNRKLQEAFWQHVFCRWSIWIYSAPKVHWEALKCFSQIVHTQSHALRRAVGVQRLLDALYFYYWYEQRGIGLQAQAEEIHHPVTGEVDGHRPDSKALASLRGFLFASIQSMVQQGIRENETEALVAALVETADTYQLRELLDFVYQLLLAGIPDLASQLLQQADLSLFLMFLRHEDEEIVLRSLLIIALLVRWRRENPGHSSNNGLTSLEAIEQELLQIGSVLDRCNMRIYGVLYNLLVGLISLRPVTIDDETRICNVSLLPVILSLLLLADFFVRQKALQDLSVLLSRSDSNCATVLEGCQWIHLLMDLLSDQSATITSEPASEELARARRITAELIYNFFRILIFHAGRSDTLSQYKLIQQIVLTGTYYESRGLLSQKDFLRALYTKLLRAWRTEITSREGAQPPGLTTDFVRFLGLFEQFLFYTPRPEDIRKLQSKLKGKESFSGLRESGHSLTFVPPASPLRTDRGATYSPTKAVSWMSWHLEGARWKDLGIAQLLLDVLRHLNPGHFVHASLVKQVGKSAERATELRTTPQMVLLRVVANVLRFGSVSNCLETIPLLRELLRVDMAKKPNARTQYVLLQLLRVLHESVTQEEEGAGDKAKVLLPFVKELLVFSMPSLPSTMAPYRAALSAQQSFHEFQSAATSDAWTAAFAWATQTLAQVTGEERAFCVLLDRRYLKNIQLVLHTLQQLEIAKERRASSLTAAFHHIHTHPLKKEVERKLKVAKERDDALLLIRRTWRNILRSLTNERGPWASTDENRIYWKLDKTENYSRMRLKLKRNYHFESHADAARDGLGADSQSEEELTPALLIVSGMKLAAMESELEAEENLLLPPEAEEAAEVVSPQAEERVLYTTSCDLITPMKVTPGRMEISTTHLTFREALTEESDPSEEGGKGSPAKEVRIALESIRGIHLRRYLLRRSALEIFKSDRRNYFFNFDIKERGRVYNKVVSLRPPNLTYLESGSPANVLRRSGLTRRWQQRQMSNFDYLMQLNTIAGRSFNDLSQYPVFPWVLQDYSSAKLDLQNPDVYRDLSLPIGALKPSRREELQIRFEAFADPNIPQFHHGSHYSSSGIVLFYLLRLEPFTSHFLTLQGGKFDHADRMFDSIASCWNNLLTGSADVKELIPEFYFLPDFLDNQNRFNLGTKQNGRALDDVLLPPWAANAHDFVRQHREALESDYVSEHLHEWIDLIFGYKQRGPAAEAALNVFYYLTYEGAVNLDSIEDEAQRLAMESQIENFGQTPAQLMNKPHPKRLSPLEVQRPYLDKVVRLATPSRLQQLLLNPRDSEPLYQVSMCPLAVHSDPLVFVCDLPFFFRTSPVREYSDPNQSDTLVVVTESRSAHTYRLVTSLSTGPAAPPQFSLEQEGPAVGSRRIGAPFAAGLTVGGHLFACSRDGAMVLSCGHWDSSIKCSWLNQSHPQQSLNKHKDVVTCLAIGADGRTFVTGSRDTTVLVWQITYIKGVAYRVEEMPLHILYGHNDDVTCVAVDTGLDVCISGSKDGTCIIHNLQEGVYVRSIYHPADLPITLVALSSLGYVVFYSKEDLMLYVFDINGNELMRYDVPERLEQIFVPPSGRHVVTSGQDNSLCIREIHSMKLLQRVALPHRVLSITMSADEHHIAAALSDGHLLLLSLIDESPDEVAARRSPFPPSDDSS